MAEPAKATTLPRRLASKAVSANATSRYARDADVPNREQMRYVDGNTVRNLRQSNRIVEALRTAVRLDGTLSTALFDMVQVANTKLVVKAYDSMTHQFSREGTLVARNALVMMDTVWDYGVGFADRRSVKQIKESALREVILTGAVAGELVLDKARYPDRIQLVPFESLVWKARGDGNGKYPIQRGYTPQEIALDIPNFWVVESHLGADDPYPRSMLEAALPTLFYYGEFIEDTRRVVRRTGHSRLVVTLSAEKVQAAAPEAAKKTEAAMKAHMESVREEVETVLAGMEPEDALVIYDVGTVEDVSGRGDKADYTELLQVLAGMAATSLKSMPSVLGLRLSGSQSLSNTESLIFLKVAAAAQTAVSIFMSRALTLTARLFGVDCYVKARFSPINLRPEDELEAFKTMRQDRILELLSVGLIGDDDATEELGLPPRPAGAPALSGTFFRDSVRSTRAGEVSPNSDPMGRALQPDSPSKAGGRSQ
jgi:hypothetical protein